MSATIACERVGGAVLLRFEGEIDLANASELEAQATSMLGDAAGAVVDLTDVSYFDSSGMRMLDGLARTCAEAELPLRVVAPEPGPVRFLLRMCAWRRDLLSGEVDEALAGVGARRA